MNVPDRVSRGGSGTFPPRDSISKSSVIIVDSGSDIFHRLRDMLLSRSCSVDHAHTAGALDKALSDTYYDVIVLNVTLPDADGLIVLRRLTLMDHRPGILVVSGTDDEIDRIVALEVGADDCVAKSCTPREINARVGAIMRRRVSECERTEESDRKALAQASFRFSGWTLQCDSRQLFTPLGYAVSVTNREYEILSLLLSDPGIVRDRASLLGSTEGETSEELRSVDVLVSRLRKKLAQYGGQELIQTVPDRGYRIIS
jgi:DNA-binding response OmpR family regulator